MNDKVTYIRDVVPTVWNTFSEVELIDMFIEKFEGFTGVLDLRCLNFSLGKQGPSSSGTLYKACTNYYYFKLSSFSKYVPDDYGYESVCEVVASRVSDLFEFRHVEYFMLHALVLIGSKEYTVWLCVSRNYKAPNEHRTTLENALWLNGISGHDLKENYNYVKTQPYAKDIKNMLFLDYLIDNRDRHGANIELLISDAVQLAPIFDCGCSLVLPMLYDKDKLRAFNPLHDGPINNFLISSSWEDVLHELFTDYELPVPVIDELYLDDLGRCFSHGGKAILASMKSMIERRYRHAKEVFHTCRG